MKRVLDWVHQKMARKGLDPINPTIKVGRDGTEVDQGLAIYIARVTVSILAIILLTVLLVTPTVTGLFQVFDSSASEQSHPIMDLLNDEVLPPLRNTHALLEEDTAPRVRSIQTAVELRIPGDLKSATQQILHAIKDTCVGGDGGGTGPAPSCPPEGVLPQHHSAFKPIDPDSFTPCATGKPTFSGSPAASSSIGSFPWISSGTQDTPKISMTMSSSYLGFYATDTYITTGQNKRSVSVIGLGRLTVTEDGRSSAVVTEAEPIHHSSLIGYQSTGTGITGTVSFFRTTGSEDTADAQDVGIRSHTLLVMRRNRKLDTYVYEGGEIQGGDMYMMASPLSGQGTMVGDEMVLLGYAVPVTNYAGPVWCPNTFCNTQTMEACKNASGTIRFPGSSTGLAVVMVRYMIQDLDKDGFKPKITIHMLNREQWPIPGPYHLTSGTKGLFISVYSWGWYGHPVSGEINRATWDMRSIRLVYALLWPDLPETEGKCYTNLANPCPRACTIGSTRIGSGIPLTFTGQLSAWLTISADGGATRLKPEVAVSYSDPSYHDLVERTYPYTTAATFTAVEGSITCFMVSGLPQCITLIEGDSSAYATNLQTYNLWSLPIDCPSTRNLTLTTNTTSP
ncbi:hemagglutinin-neuraminidase [Wenling triplecross lizardfish paramyxovirus]|uniref:Hemagglutinin-neuraminidase n=1 Tax=Wenling triplecross lizardfish paramyxovirus TaxID=2116451 RepID=A0A2P1GN25_9MONO|nr:hemagglutinin-neuraminidase [Wenling triplecross lizardfish paramyxovirus]AVM87368.1 hemagglutinin-neuraminidase [Wenling triplecross lizardfish paramyxovirus]AVM87390.1 hemagglutinin-neuraminidase [Wenling triplecross lizardfish paramyxovirus]